jgi:dsDNA-binding SOS-regulon protein
MLLSLLYLLIKIVKAVEDWKTAAIAAATSTLAAATTYVLSQRKETAEIKGMTASAKLTEADSIDKLIDTSNKLISMATEALEREKKEHHECRQHLIELTKRIENIECKISH